MGMGGTLSLLDVVLMNLVAVASLRWIASAASIGPSSLVLWCLAALLFFVPEGLSVAELSSRFPGQGGLYRWTKSAFGEGHGFFCGWCYWVNNLLYFPGLLLYVSANVAFAVMWAHPSWHLDVNKPFLVGVTLGTLWLVAGLSILGMRAGKWLQNLGGVGNWVPALMVAGLGLAAWFLYGSANRIDWSTVRPNFSDWGKLSFFSQLCFALAGLELVSFVGGEVRNPRKTVTRAVLISAVMILSVYLIGTLGILVSVPQKEITLVNGILLPVQQIGVRWHVPWLGGVCAAFIALGGIGATMAWFAGVARVPYLAGIDHFLPKSFGDLHPRFHTPVTSIVVQTLAATAFTLFATAGGARLETAYQVLVDMCLVLYFIPYCYLFACVYRLSNRGRFAKALIAGSGFFTTLFAIVTSLLPVGDQIDWSPSLKAGLGTLVMAALGLLLYRQGCRSKQRFESSRLVAM